MNQLASATYKAGRPDANAVNRTAIRPNTRSTIQRVPPAIRVMLVDPAELVHLAVRTLLAEDPRYSRPIAATTIAAAEQLVRQVRPRLLISEIDLGGRSGIELCRWVRCTSPITQVVFLTSRNEPLLATAALAAGAAGYLLKDSPPDVLRASLEQAAAGRAVIDDRLGFHGTAAHRIDAADQLGFSRRERDVLGELVSGQDNRSIAAALGIAEETVKSHLKSIFRKLGARDRAHALALVIGTATTERAFP